MRTLLTLVSLFALSAGTALANDENSIQVTHQGTGGDVSITTSTSSGKWELHRNAKGQRVNVDGKNISSDQKEKMATAQFRGLPGRVSTVGSGSFTIELPGNRQNATTTFTVNVSSTTKYLHASSTASFVDITVGSRVVVLGKISSSTKSVAAERIVILPDSMEKKHDEGQKGGFFSRIKHLFFKDKGTEIHGKAEVSADGTHTSAAAFEGTGLARAILKSFFSWF